MEGRTLIQYLIDTSDVMLAKKQEATEYLAKLEQAAQQSVQRTATTEHVFPCNDPTCEICDALAHSR